MELSMEKRKNACGEDPALSPSAVLSGLYDRYGNDVLRLCCMFMKTRPDAEDAVSEAVERTPETEDLPEEDEGPAAQTAAILRQDGVRSYPLTGPFSAD